MRIASLAFLAGSCLIYLLPNLLPWWPFALLLTLTTGLAYRFRRRKASQLLMVAGFFFAAIALMLWHCQRTLHWQLAKAWEGKSVSVVGRVISLPAEKDRYLSFEMQLTQFDGKPVNTRIKLNWYNHRHAYAPLQLGERWQLLVRLKRPHGLSNPGSFDSQRWAFLQGIRALGYVVNNQQNKRLSAVHWTHPIEKSRQQLQQFYQQQLAGKPLGGMLTALSIGDKSHITQAQWQVLQHTGTSHLMAISGLHIGLIAGLAFLLMGFFWRCLPRAPLWIATPRVAAIGGLVAAFVYSAMAGFSIPTQRASIMLVVILGGVILRRQLITWTGLAIALFLVLLLNPLSVLSGGFWLSFSAVAALIYGLGGRVNPSGWWWQWGRTQWVASVGLIPLTLLYFQNVSWVSPIANSIAIPWVGFITVPLNLIASGVYFISPWLAHTILLLAYYSLQGVWYLLSYFSAQPVLAWQHTISDWQFVSILFGVILLLAPRGWPMRYLAAVFLLPLVLSSPSPIAKGQCQITQLDVGQGLATVVRTQHHVLVYDTGAKYSAEFDMGKAVVIPYLRQRGVAKIDALVISHGDNDHSGGADSVLATIPVKTLYTSVPKKFSRPASLCLQGKHWQWDGVDFRFLYPQRQHLGLNNDSSCVLRISTGQQHALLTGDIERFAERQLLQQQRKQLPATVLMAPHHGSNTSSTSAFIKAVDPHYVIFSVGYRNRFGFPKAAVVKRYQQRKRQLLDTASEGAITLLLTASGAKVLQLHRRRQFIWMD